MDVFFSFSESCYSKKRLRLRKDPLVWPLKGILPVCHEDIYISSQSYLKSSKAILLKVEVKDHETRVIYLQLFMLTDYCPASVLYTRFVFVLQTLLTQLDKGPNPVFFCMYAFSIMNVLQVFFSFDIKCNHRFPPLFRHTLRKLSFSTAAKDN